MARKKETDGTVSVVLCGIGGYGMLYVDEIVDHYAALRIRVAGLVDPFPQRCPGLAKIAPLAEGIYPSLDAFYAEKRADLAVIATPIGYHAEQILCALSHGSNVLCEKPLCGDEKDIPLLEEAERRSGKFVCIGYQWSHSVAVEALKRDILRGIYGAPISLKTLILWPRDDAYYHRSTGWAGRIADADGRLILDSIANNAAAHYLHNMFYVLGADVRSSRMPDAVRATLLRANDIENYDTADIICRFSGGAVARFLASHAVGEECNPCFRYGFSQGEVLFATDSVPEDGSAAHPYLPGHIVGYTADGERRDYGDPFTDQIRKFHIALATVRGEKAGWERCGIRAAAVHTRVIAAVQKEYAVIPVAPRYLERKANQTTVTGLAERLRSVYATEKGGIGDFGAYAGHRAEI